MADAAGTGAGAGAAEVPQAGNPGIAYERRDLPLRELGLAALGVAVLLGIIAPLAILRSFPSARYDVDRRLHVLPPAPRLQIDPRLQLSAYLRKEQTLLDSYGWIDRAHGIARIPISVAMERLAQQGAAGFPSPTASPTAGLAASPTAGRPGESK